MHPRVATNTERDKPALAVISAAVVDNQTREGAARSALEPVALENHLVQTTKETHGAIEPVIARPAATKTFQFRSSPPTRAKQSQLR
jgi:hypothetical protein